MPINKPVTACFKCGFVWYAPDGNPPRRCPRCNGEDVGLPPQPARKSPAVRVARLVLLGVGLLTVAVLAGYRMGRTSARPPEAKPVATTTAFQGEPVVPADRPVGIPEAAVVRTPAPKPAPAASAAPSVAPPPPRAAESAIPYERRRALFMALQAITPRAEQEAERKLGRRPKPGKEELLQFRLDFRRETEKAAKAMRAELAQKEAVTLADLTAIQAEGDREGWPKA